MLPPAASQLVSKDAMVILSRVLSRVGLTRVYCTCMFATVPTTVIGLAAYHSYVVLLCFFADEQLECVHLPLGRRLQMPQAPGPNDLNVRDCADRPLRVMTEYNRIEQDLHLFQPA